MKINLLQAFLIGIIYYLSVNGTPWLSLLGSTVMARPLICGMFVGFVLGNPIQGIIYGAAISLPFLAYISAGGTVPMDPGLAGTLWTALAMASKTTPNVAVTLAVPIGLLGTVIWIMHMTVDISFLHLIDKAAANADYRKADRIQMYLPQIFLLVITVIPAAVVVYFGSGPVAGLLTSLKGVPMHILNVIGGVLPALGIAMILKSINNKNILIYYAIGVILAVYLKLPIIAVSIIGLIIGLLHTQLEFKIVDK